MLLLVSVMAVSCVQRRAQKESDPKGVQVIESSQGQVTTQNPTPYGEDVIEATQLSETKDDLKIGILIGPGGARTWAAIGVLREFEKANIAVDVVGGMEWGSFIAALYSQKGKTNDVEWRSLKIEENHFRKGLLSSVYEPKNLNELQKELKTIFENQRAESSKLKYVCGADSFRMAKSSMLYRGLFTEVMNYCLAYPPLIETYKGWNASSLRVKPYVEALKNLGANYLILIDVAQGASPLGSQRVSAETSILWMEVQSALKASGKSFNQVIEIKLDKPLTDFKSRKEFIAIGERIGKQAVQSLKDQL